MVYRSCRLIPLMALAVLIAGFLPGRAFDAARAARFTGQWVEITKSREQRRMSLNISDLYMAETVVSEGAVLARHVTFLKAGALEHKADDVMVMRAPDTGEYSTMRLRGGDQLLFEHFRPDGSLLESFLYERCKPGETAVADGAVEAAFPEIWTDVETGEIALALSFAERAVRFFSPKALVYGADPMPLLGFGQDARYDPPVNMIVFAGKGKDRFFVIDGNGLAELEAEDGKLKAVGRCAPAEK